MKFHTPILFLCGCVCGLVFGLSLKTGKAVDTTPPEHVADGAGTLREPVPMTLEAPITTVTWPEPGNENLPLLLSKLRELGCPRGWANDIIIAEANKQFGSACLKLHQGLTGDKDQDVAATLDRLKASLDGLQMSRVRRIRDLAQQDLSKDDEMIGMAYRNVKPAELLMSPEGLSELQRIESRFSSQIESIKGKSDGFLTKADREAIESLRRQRDLERQRLLGEDSYRAYALLDFVSSDEYNQKYSNFQPSWAELEGILKYSEASASLSASPFTEEVQEQMRQELARSMSAGRLEEFMKFQDPAYREGVALARRFGLPQTTADTLMELRRNALDRPAVVTPDMDLAGLDSRIGDRSKALRQQVTDLLGAEAAEAYYRDAETSLWAK